MSTQIAPSPLRDVPEQGEESPPYPLENGDKLSLAEFERRYEAMPHVKAELIEGIVYMGSPVGYKNHGNPHWRIIGWGDRYVEATPGVDAADNTTVLLDLEDMTQPDAFLFILPEAGGRIKFGEQGYIEGGPELVIEVASSSASYDLHAKLRAYQKNGVPEYVIWRTRDAAVDWFILRDGEYRRLEPGDDGIYRSEVFPGLWLDWKSLVNGDRSGTTRTLNLGLASPEHAAFVDRLQPHQA